MICPVDSSMMGSPFLTICGSWMYGLSNLEGWESGVGRREYHFFPGSTNNRVTTASLTKPSRVGTVRTAMDQGSTTSNVSGSMAAPVLCDYRPAGGALPGNGALDEHQAPERTMTTTWGRRKRSRRNGDGGA